MATGGNTVRLTDRADTYTTKTGDEYVYALGGDDKITFGGFYWPDDEEYGHLEVHGGSGNDRILGGAGNSGQVSSRRGWQRLPRGRARRRGECGPRRPGQ